MIDKSKKNTSIKKLKDEVLNSKKVLMNLKFQKSTGQLEKTAEIRKTRKNIAKLKTEIKQLDGDNNA